MDTAQPADIRLLCLDVDGVLTDGSIWLDSNGDELKRFHVRDGLGIKAWQTQGNQIAVVTGRGGPAMQARMAELGVEHVLERVSDKAESVRSLQEQLGFTPGQTAFMGDDLADLPAFAGSGYAMAPSDADEEVLARADWVSARRGGQGAVREGIEHLLRSRGVWEEVVARHLDTGNLA